MSAGRSEADPFDGSGAVEEGVGFIVGKELMSSTSCSILLSVLGEAIPLVESHDFGNPTIPDVPRRYFLP